MLLTLTLTRPPATDLGHLLHKHPERLQSFSLPFGQAHVFYPEASEERCTAALMLEVDPVGLIRRGVRFPRLETTPVPVYYVRVDIELLSGSENFHEAVEHICFRKNSQGRTASAGRTAARATASSEEKRS